MNRLFWYYTTYSCLETPWTKEVNSQVFMYKNFYTLCWNFKIYIKFHLQTHLLSFNYSTLAQNFNTTKLLNCYHWINIVFPAFAYDFKINIGKENYIRVFKYKTNLISILCSTSNENMNFLWQISV